MKYVLLLIISCFTIKTTFGQKSRKSNHKSKTLISTNYISDDNIPDSATKFTGIIKYMMITDYPYQKDSMYIIFGDNKIRVRMFLPGFKINDVYEENMIADFKENKFISVDVRNNTYTIEDLGNRNPGVIFDLANFKNKRQILQTPCQEYAGEMRVKEGEVFQVSTIVSNKHSYFDIKDYNFMNIQPTVVGNKIVLGYRSVYENRETTMILAYEIESGDTAAYFDLSHFTLQ